MKKEIHPHFNKKAQITCACGATYQVGSTSDSISVEICSACHPFYTGKEKLVDTAGRVDKFRARVAAAKQFKGSPEKTTDKTEENVEKIEKDENSSDK